MNDLQAKNEPQLDKKNISHCMHREIKLEPLNLLETAEIAMTNDPILELEQE